MGSARVRHDLATKALPPPLVNFTFLGSSYFCIPIDILQFCLGVQLSFLELIWICQILWLVVLSRFSRVWLCATPWTAACQAPLSMGFSRQEHWSGLPFPSPCGWLGQAKISCSRVLIIANFWCKTLWVCHPIPNFPWAMRYSSLTECSGIQSHAVSPQYCAFWFF